METKSFALTEVKAVGDVPGEFEAIVSVFGNVDSYGDRMVKGAFTRTLNEKGLPPIVWSHEWSVAPIGIATSATETDEGLLIKGRLFVGPGEDHAVAKQVHVAMVNGAIREFSFGYSTKASNDVVEDGATVREITDVELYEVGPTLVGANSATRLVGVKALERAVASELEQPPAAVKSSTTEPVDNPVPTTPVAVSEEDLARISRLLSARPILTQTGVGHEA